MLSLKEPNVKSIAAAKCPDCDQSYPTHYTHTHAECIKAIKFKYEIRLRDLMIGAQDEIRKLRQLKTPETVTVTAQTVTTQHAVEPRADLQAIQIVCEQQNAVMNSVLSVVVSLDNLLKQQLSQPRPLSSIEVVILWLKQLFKRNKSATSGN